eukprot:1160468-Pelagomonas_calceolata.AAC.8
MCMPSGLARKKVERTMQHPDEHCACTMDWHTQGWATSCGILMSIVLALRIGTRKGGPHHVAF